VSQFDPDFALDGDATAEPPALARVRGWLEAQGLEWSEPSVGLFSFNLPGERKLQTPVRLDVGRHALAVHAFVCRRPDENHAGVYAWMLQRNLRLYAVSFALDAVGDIYLDGRLPLVVLDGEHADDELDRLLGTVLSTADESFNTLLELGFASSIRKEWEWRRLRGESTANLEAFRGWLERDERSGSGSGGSGGEHDQEGHDGR
jgi:hypothetical protein